MALTFDFRQPISRPRIRDIRSKIMHCLAVGSIVSSFTFILAVVMGLF
ncbi:MULTISPECIES: hypothetical protein [unclassified Sinorhizobium]